MEIWKSGILEIWKSGIPEIWGPENPKKISIISRKLSEKLNNENFRDKAPKTVIEKFESDHEDLKSKLNKQKSLLEGLEKINN